MTTTREEIIRNFDPNAPGATGNIFGLPFPPEHSSVVLIPVPWEVTVSYRTGTSVAPEAICQASTQVDLAVKDIPDAWKLGISMLPVPENLKEESSALRQLAAQRIAALERGESAPDNDPVLAKVNAGSENLHVYIKSLSQRYLREGKIVGLVGGDHSTPLGLMRALAEQHQRFGILQIDAHMDLRKAYEGFTYSHASIMYNAMKLPAVGRLVQVGIRDYCDEELEVVKRGMGRIVTFFDQDIKDRMFEGKTWSAICEKIIAELPAEVYISFDIDGLEPMLCPNTGTPVPGGLSFEQAVYLIRKVAQSGRKIIGFDLNEVAPGKDDWDANVGARLLYQMCCWAGVSRGKLLA